MERQLDIFEFIENPEKKPEKKPEIGNEELKEWAFLYTAGRAGRHTGIRFMMSLEDARAWCSSDLSKGNMHGNPWMYMYTSVYNYCYCHWGQIKGAVLDLTHCADNGEWDERIESLGLKKLNIYDIKRELSRYGISVLTHNYSFEREEAE